MLANPDVVVIVEPKGDKENDSIPGIRGLYRLRATGIEKDTRIIQYREVACWCPYCIQSDYSNCLVQSRWESINLDAASKPKRITKCSVCKLPGRVIIKTASSA